MDPEHGHFRSGPADRDGRQRRADLHAGPGPARRRGPRGRGAARGRRHADRSAGAHELHLDGHRRRRRHRVAHLCHRGGGGPDSHLRRSGGPGPDVDPEHGHFRSGPADRDGRQRRADLHAGPGPARRRGPRGRGAARGRRHADRGAGAHELHLDGHRRRRRHRVAHLCHRGGGGPDSHLRRSGGPGPDVDPEHGHFRFGPADRDGRQRRADLHAGPGPARRRGPRGRGAARGRRHADRSAGAHGLRLDGHRRRRRHGVAHLHHRGAGGPDSHFRRSRDPGPDVAPEPGHSRSGPAARDGRQRRADLHAESGPARRRAPGRGVARDQRHADCGAGAHGLRLDGHRRRRRHGVAHLRHRGPAAHLVAGGRGIEGGSRGPVHPEAVAGATPRR